MNLYPLGLATNRSTSRATASIEPLTTSLNTIYEHKIGDLYAVFERFLLTS